MSKKEKFEKLARELHEEGYDVVLVLSLKRAEGVDVTQRTLLHGETEQEKADAFLRCNRALREELQKACDQAERRVLDVSEVLPRSAEANQSRLREAIARAQERAEAEAKQRDAWGEGQVKPEGGAR